MKDEKKRLFPEIDQNFIREMDDEDQKSHHIFASFNMRQATALTVYAKVLHEKPDKHFTQEEFRLVNKMLAFCQNPFSDEKSIRLILDELLRLYEPLINGASRQIIARCKKWRKVEFDDIKSFAQVIFCRLVTGDMPSRIKRYEDTETCVKARTIDRVVDLSDKRVPDLKIRHDKKFDDLFLEFKGYDLNESDLKAVEMIFAHEKQHFHEIITISTTKKTLEEFVCSLLTYDFEVSKRLAKEGSTVEVRGKYKIRVESYNNIFSSKKLFLETIELNRVYFDELYIKYKKHAYRNERFPNDGTVNFTVYMKRTLYSRLLDVVRSKPYERSVGDIGELEYEDDAYQKHGVKGAEELDGSTLPQCLFEDADSMVEIKKRLTERQVEILELLVKEPFQQKQIAECLDVSEACVSKHMKKIRKVASGFGIYL